MKVNGQTQALPCVTDRAGPCAVSAALTRSAWRWKRTGISSRAAALQRRRLCDADTVEIVQFVGGG